METVRKHVRDLDREDRSALERVVGHSLGDAQHVIIQVAGEQPASASNGQTSLPGQLPEWCNVYEGLTDEQIGDLDRSIYRLPGGRDV